MKPRMRIGDTVVEPGRAPYIIAEIGVNHENSFSRACEMIDLAKEGGAHAVKFQSYKAASLASKHSPAYWDTTKEATRSQRELFAKYDSFGSKEYGLLAAHCRSVGIDFLSTPFDLDAVEFLNDLMPCYKIASADITNIPLLRQVAAKRKPVILSTGAATLAEIETALAIIRAVADVEVALLHCVLNYPTPNELASLGMIGGLARCFPQLIIGYSDHTFPQEDLPALEVAYLKGALILEKHFTFDKTLPGNDHYHAMDMHDLKRFRQRLAIIMNMLGQSEIKAPLPSEGPAREHARRSIVLNRAIKAGHLLQEKDLTCKRPAHGISPLYWDSVIGKRVLQDCEEDHVLQWSDVDAGAM